MNLDEDTNISKEEFFKVCESETLLGSVCHYLDRCLDWQSLSLFFYRIERQTHVVSVVSLFILQLSTIHSVFFCSLICLVLVGHGFAGSGRKRGGKFVPEVGDSLLRWMGETMEVATSEMSLKCHKQTWWMLWMSLVPSDHFRFDPDKSGFLDKEDRCCLPMSC